MRCLSVLGLLITVCGCSVSPDLSRPVVDTAPLVSPALIAESTRFVADGGDVGTGMALASRLLVAGDTGLGRQVLGRLWDDGYRGRRVLHAIHNATLEKGCRLGVDCLNDLLGERPDDGELLNLLGLQLIVQEQFVLARSSLQRAASDPAADVRVIANLIRVHLLIGDSRAALSSLARYEERAGMDGMAHRFRAQLALLDGESSTAEIHLREAYALDRNPLSVRELADMLVRNGKHGEAIGHYRQLVDAGTGGAGVHGNLAYALLEQGDARGAVASARTAIAVSEEYGPAWRTLGRAQLRLKDFDNACVSLEHALDKTHDGVMRARIRYEVGEVYYASMRLTQARHQFRLAVHLLEQSAVATDDDGITVSSRLSSEESVPAEVEAPILRRYLRAYLEGDSNSR